MQARRWTPQDLRLVVIRNVLLHFHACAALSRSSPEELSRAITTYERDNQVKWSCARSLGVICTHTPTGEPLRTISLAVDAFKPCVLSTC